MGGIRQIVGRIFADAALALSTINCLRLRADERDGKSCYHNCFHTSDDIAYIGFALVNQHGSEENRKGVAGVAAKSSKAVSVAANGYHRAAQHACDDDQ